jgi:hypothetical protein
MGYGLWVMGYGLWVMGYGLWVMGYGKIGGWHYAYPPYTPLTPHSSLLTPHPGRRPQHNLFLSSPRIQARILMAIS